ncbi:hypothetical protein GCM10010873_32440 [Cypionkella aquatica]|uniref:Uncharacterized protein n=1 Tax=Cypionkella aquatica TaxID=1756042 RepID=A0AA37U7J7_9RHOB|nr:hypothetical protein [Cypionkella aquatica]GLS88270.1 hypothetical protein GCM10010873_32440 [Cypionkella aquatica]
MMMVQTDPRLLTALVDAAKRGVSAAQLHRQKVSYITTSLSDEKTKITTEMVERELRKLDGTAA